MSRELLTAKSSSTQQRKTSALPSKTLTPGVGFAACAELRLRQPTQLRLFSLREETALSRRSLP